MKGLAEAMPEGTGGIAAPQPPRSFGTLELDFVMADGKTRLVRAFQEGVMRVRFPNVPRNAPPEAVVINTAGGLTGGDRVAMTVALGDGACLTVTTQAHEKVYRTQRDAVSVDAALHVGAGAALEWLPQPTILFDRARLARRTHVTLADGARFLGVEAVIFGRTAMSEIMAGGALDDRWSIRRDGRLIHLDRFALDGEMAKYLARPSVLEGCAALATIRLVAPDAPAHLETARALLGADGAASAWDGMLLARVVARDGFGLGAVLARLLTGLRGRPLPPVWTI